VKQQQNISEATFCSLSGVVTCQLKGVRGLDRQLLLQSQMLLKWKAEQVILLPTFRCETRKNDKRGTRGVTNFLLQMSKTK
jgi:hypothetical protein